MTLRVSPRALFFACLTLAGCGRSLSQARPSTGAGDRARLMMEVETRAATDPAFASCTSQVSRAEFDCAMQAGTADAIERCLL